MLKVELLHAIPVHNVLIARANCYGGKAMETSDSVIETCQDCGTTVTRSLGNRDAKRIEHSVAIKHESVLEFAEALFFVEGVSRSLTHQLVRHRIASYAQRSQRYVKEDMFDYVTPPSIKGHDDPEVLKAYDDMMVSIQECYNSLVAKGIKPEDARYVLPNACETAIVCKFNARSLRNLAALRLDPHAQWEIRMLVREMMDNLPADYYPIFKDLFERFLSVEGENVTGV